MSGLRVLVTGATGFFGPAIVEALREAGHEPIGAARRPPPGGVALDVTAPASCRAAFTARPGIDAVVHAAALAHVPPGRQAREACRAVNVVGTRHMLDAAVAAGASRFVFISSVSVYGEYDLPPAVTEDHPPANTSVYGAAKVEGEALVAARAGELAAFRFRMATMYSSDWVFNIRKRVAPPVLGRFLHVALDPHRRRYSLCARRNGAAAVVAALGGGVPPGAYNVSDQYVYSQAEIGRAVARVDGARPCITVPAALVRAAAAGAAAFPHTLHAAIRARYWKYCEANVYPSDRLAACGVALPPQLPGVEASR